MIETLVLLMTGFGGYNPDYWHTQMMFGEMGVVLWISVYIYRQIHFIPAIAFLYFGAYGIFSEFFHINFTWESYNPKADFEINSARSILFFLCATIPFIFANYKSIKRWAQAFHILAITNSIVMLKNAAMGKHATGLIGMDSIDGCFLGLMLPLVFYSKNSKIKWASYFLMILAMLFSRSSTVFGILCLYLIALVARELKFRTIKDCFLSTGAMVAFGLCTVPMGFLYLGDQLFQPNGRHTVHQLFFQLCQIINNTLHQWPWGVGNGVFLTLMPEIEGRNHQFFVWLHDEPMQILGEQGAIGLAFLILLFGGMIYKNRHRFPILLSILAAGFISFLQPCFRYFLFAIFMAFLVRASYENDLYQSDQC